MQIQRTLPAQYECCYSSQYRQSSVLVELPNKAYAGSRSNDNMLLCQDATPSVDVLFLKAFEKLGDALKVQFLLFNLPKGNKEYNTVCLVAFSFHHVYFSQQTYAHKQAWLLAHNGVKSFLLKHCYFHVVHTFYFKRNFLKMSVEQEELSRLQNN